MHWNRYVLNFQLAMLFCVVICYMVVFQVSQLKHEINLKEDLLHTYANDETDSSGAPSPIKGVLVFLKIFVLNVRPIKCLQIHVLNYWYCDLICVEYGNLI